LQRAFSLVPFSNKERETRANKRNTSKRERNAQERDNTHAHIDAHTHIYTHERVENERERAIREPSLQGR